MRTCIHPANGLPTIRIRAATERDMEGIRKIQENVVLAATGGRYALAEMCGQRTPWSGRDFGRAAKEGRLFVAADEAKKAPILGYCEFDANSGEILAIGVAPACQGEGVGRELVRECLKRRRAAAGDKVHVKCSPGVAGFFGRLGFESSESLSMTLPRGDRIDVFKMTRPVEHPFLAEQIRALEDSVNFFGAGEDRQRARDRYVVEMFLNALRIRYTSEEITQEEDPPDARFRDANFEVKELYSIGRRRHDEYKEELRKAREAFWPDELLTPYKPKDISLAQVVHRVVDLAKQRGSRYAPATRGTLDLLVYANLLHVESIIPVALGKLEDLDGIGWRSVSFVKGMHAACVLMANNQAPEFLREREKVLFRDGSASEVPP